MTDATTLLAQALRKSGGLDARVNEWTVAAAILAAASDELIVCTVEELVEAVAGCCTKAGTKRHAKHIATRIREARHER